MELIIKRFSLRNLLNNLYKIYYLDTKEKNIDFIVTIAPSIPEYIYEDEFRINQIITNLLSNAIKFTKDGRIDVIAKLDENKLIIIVRDTGIGINKEFLRDLFTPFKQINNNIKTNYSGTGLGLAITKSLVELLSGIITVNSEENIGTEFIITIPIKKNYQNKDINDADQMVKKWIKNMNYDSNDTEFTSSKINEDDDYTELIIDAICFIEKKIIIIKDMITNKRWSELKVLTHEITGFTGNLKMDELYNCIKKIDQLLTDKILDENKIFLLFMDFEAIYNQIPSKYKDCNKNIILKSKNDVNILLAEDNYVNQVLFKKILKKLNLDCDIANNGEEAIKILQKKKYDILFLDLQMPVLDGKEVLRNIMQNNKTFGKIYIIVLTAEAIEETREICKMLGADDFITKPIDIELLKNKIKTLLEI